MEQGEDSSIRRALERYGKLRLQGKRVESSQLLPPDASNGLIERLSRAVDEYERLMGEADQKTVVGSTPELEAPRDGPVVPGYRLARILGRGGMGSVWLGVHDKLNRRDAIKVVSRSFGIEYEERFLREARAVARLNHPSIVPVYNCSSTTDHCFIVMKLIEGLSLDTVLDLVARSGNTERDRPWYLEQIRKRSESTSASSVSPPTPLLDPTHVLLGLEILGPISGALHCAHEEHLIHRDVKPGNILLDQKLKPYLADFGIARDQRDQPATMTRGFVGTVQYASPEQLTPGATVDRRSDLYSLGATLFHWLFLRPIRTEVEERVPRRYRAALRRLPRDLAAVLERCLEPEPADRYQTGLELAEDLERIEQGRPPLARRMGTPIRVLRVVSRGIGRHPLSFASASLLSLLATAFLTSSWRSHLEALSVRNREWSLRYRVDGILAASYETYEKGREYFERALATANDPHQVLTEYSLLEASAGQNEKALELLDQALEARTTKGLLLRRAELLRRLGQVSKASQVQQHAGSFEEVDAWYEYFQASDDLKAGEVLRAVEGFTRALALDPDHVPSLLRLIRIKKQLGRSMDVVSIASQLLKMSLETKQTARLVNEVLLDVSDLELTSRLWVDQDSPDSTKFGGAFQCVNKLIKRDYQGAIESATQSIKATPDWFFPYYVRGAARLGVGNLDRSEEDLEKCVQFLPHPGAYYHLGIIASKHRQHEKSLSYFRKTLEITPAWLKARIQLCMKLALLGRWEECLLESEKALALSPDQSQLAHYAGLAAINLERYHDALRLTHGAEGKERGDPFLFLTRGIALHKTNQNAEAIRFFRLAIECDPHGRTETPFHLAGSLHSWAMFHGDPGQKAEAYREAIEILLALDPGGEQHDVQGNLGIYYYRYGEYQLANAHLSRALDLIVSKSEQTLGLEDEIRLAGSRRASTRIALRDHDAALEDLLRFGDPDNSQHRRWLEECCIATERWGKARRLLRLSRFKENGEGMEALLFLRSGDDESAWESLQRLHARDPRECIATTSRWIEMGFGLSPSQLSVDQKESFLEALKRLRLLGPPLLELLEGG